jgi:hypothetical protein
MCINTIEWKNSRQESACSGSKLGDITSLNDIRINMVELWSSPWTYSDAHIDTSFNGFANHQQYSSDENDTFCLNLLDSQYTECCLAHVIAQSGANQILITQRHIY